MIFLSRFTPSLSEPKILEQIFVQRHEMARRLISLIRESALTATKHHTLLIGPRGIGKTHMVSLLHHHLDGEEDLKEHLAIAHLKEEEWGIDSFFELLRRILRALAEEYPGVDLAARIEELETALRGFHGNRLPAIRPVRPGRDRTPKQKRGRLPRRVRNLSPSK